MIVDEDARHIFFTVHEDKQWQILIWLNYAGFTILLRYGSLGYFLRRDQNH